MNGAVDISLWQLALASGLLLVAIGLSVALRLGLTKGLAVAATRMVVQLFLVGLVLEWVFSTESWPLVVVLAVGMALLAGHAAVRRTARRFRSCAAETSRRHGTASPARGARCASASTRWPRPAAATCSTAAPRSTSAPTSTRCRLLTIATPTRYVAPLP